MPSDEPGSLPPDGRQPRRSGCAVRPRRTTEHGAGVLAARRDGRRESDKGLAVQTEPQAPVACKLPFLLRQAIPGLRRACSSLACAAYLKYASALAPALARLASGLPRLATKPSGGRLPGPPARERNRSAADQMQPRQRSRSA